MKIPELYRVPRTHTVFWGTKEQRAWLHKHLHARSKDVLCELGPDSRFDAGVFYLTLPEPMNIVTMGRWDGQRYQIANSGTVIFTIVTSPGSEMWVIKAPIIE